MYKESADVCLLLGQPSRGFSKLYWRAVGSTPDACCARLHAANKVGWTLLSDKPI